MNRTASEQDGGAHTRNRRIIEDPEAALSKMASGGQEIRDHDFPVSDDQMQRPIGPVGVDASAQPADESSSGGTRGKVAGDRQRVGSVGTIVNQDAADPDNFDDR